MSTTIPPFRPLSSYLPVPHHTDPYWRSALDPLDKYRSTENLPSHCDTLIIGTGLSGVSTAHYLLNHPRSPTSPEPGAPSILLVEARGACSGATSRNGGHLKPGFYSLDYHRTLLGADEAARIARFEESQIDEMELLAKEEGIDFEFRRGTSWDVFMNGEEARKRTGHWKQWQAERWDGIRGMRAWSRTECGGDYNPDEVEAVCPVRGAIMAVESPAAMLWPYKLTIALLKKCLDRGAQLQTDTPILELIKGGRQDEANGFRWIAKTRRGDIRCKRIVVATNAYTAGILPEYEGVIRPYKGVNSLLMDQRADRSKQKTIQSSINIRDDPELNNYLVPQPSGSWIVGGGFWRFLDSAPERFDSIDDSTLIDGCEGKSEKEWGLKNVLPIWVKGCENFTDGHIWSGVMANTPDYFPHIGRVPGREGVYISAGFNGKGMLIILQANKGLAALVLDGGALAEKGVPSSFETSQERISKKWA